MNFKTTLVASMATTAVVSFGSSVVLHYRLNKRLKKSFAEMNEPFEPVGKEYLIQHEAFFNSPEIMEANEFLDSFKFVDPK